MIKAMAKKVMAVGKSHSGVTTKICIKGSGDEIVTERGTAQKGHGGGKKESERIR